MLNITVYRYKALFPPWVMFISSHGCRFQWNGLVTTLKVERVHQEIPHIGFAHMCTLMWVRPLGSNPLSWLSSVSDQPSSLWALIVLSFSSGFNHHRGLCCYLLRSCLVRTLYPFSFGILLPWKTDKFQLTSEISYWTSQQFIQSDFNFTFKSRRFNCTPNF